VKVEGWLFGAIAVFLLLITPIYWFLSDDPTGTAALTLTFFLCALIAYYLIFTGRRLPERPEDRKDGEIYEGAGELGFFSPHSIWPLFLGASVAVAAASVAIGWWLFAIAAPLVAIMVCLFVFEYYRGVHEG
jgi:hypothetical protein